MAAIVAHHTLRLPGRSGRIENVERIGRGDRHAGHGSALGNRTVHQRFERGVAIGNQAGNQFLALQDQAAFRLVSGQVDRLVQKRFVGDDAARFDAA